MALGNNLKKKKLIPDNKDEKESTAKKEKTPSSVEKRKSAKKSSAKKAVTSPAKKSSNKKQPAKRVQKTKEQKAPKVEVAKNEPAVPEVSEEQTQREIVPNESEGTTKELEAVNVTAPAAREQNYLGQNEHQDQIISAYSIYIAQELFERKKKLRERYLQEIIDLQGKSIQVILITIGSEKYALDIDCVKEVVPIPTISKTPNTPDHIKGVANVRGTTYAVFDLAAKFQVIGQEVPRYLLVLSSKELKAGLPLSTLPNNFKTNGDQISHSLQTIEDALIDASYVKGIIKNEEELIYYLDINELLKNDKAIVIPDNLVEESK